MPTNPSVIVTLAAEGDLKRSLRYPHPFVTEAGTYLVVPMNEGISYPVEDTTVETFKLIAYGGHGICMPFWGATDGAAGVHGDPGDARRCGDPDRCDRRQAVHRARMGAAEGPVRLRAEAALRLLRPGRPRRHVQALPRLRASRSACSRRSTRNARRTPTWTCSSGPSTSGAGTTDALAIVQEMQAPGIERILWSNRQAPDTIRAMNDMPGVLTSRYDIYQDLMDPNVVQEQLRSMHPDWTQKAWPQGHHARRQRRLAQGLGGPGQGRQDVPLRRALRQAGPEVRRRAHAGRAEGPPLPLPLHRHHHRRALARVLPPRPPDDPQREPALEDGAAAVHVARIRSWSPAARPATTPRCPSSTTSRACSAWAPTACPTPGGRCRRSGTRSPSASRSTSSATQYRLPLWELVYHDCVVAQWYWGDYNNKLPSLWDKRDLFNVLYGTPPMFMFTRAALGAEQGPLRAKLQEHLHRSPGPSATRR